MNDYTTQSVKARGITDHLQATTEFQSMGQVLTYKRTRTGSYGGSVLAQQPQFFQCSDIVHVKRVFADNALDLILTHLAHRLAKILKTPTSVIR